MNDKNKILTIAITGGIGSGKSTVGRMISNAGCTVLDTDIIAHDLTLPGTIGLEKIVTLFGNEILNPDGSMDRAKVASMVFTDNAKLIMLESVLHPLILTELNRLVDESGEKYVFILVPLLFEANLDKMFDRIWLCYAPADIRKARAIERDGVSEEKIESRMNAQILDDEKIPLVDLVINTAVSLDETESEVRLALDNLAVEFE